ncbi:MAG: HEAT repeat domain-containing protein [Acidobacteria bacterium]|nr:HEAT repeat domain-containing protein [Acidobacteriota bacterium]
MLAAFLIQVTLKAVLLLTGAWVAARAMRRSSAASRHLVWLLALVAILVLPVVQVAAPRWDVPLWPAETPTVASVPARASAPPVAQPLFTEATPVDDAEALPDEARDAGVAPTFDTTSLDRYAAPNANFVLDTAPHSGPGRAERAQQILPTSQGRGSTGIGTSRTSPWLVEASGPGPARARVVNWPAVAVGVWVVGVALLLARLAVGLLWTARITSRAVDVDDPRWAATLADVSAAFGITSRVSLKTSRETTIPVACGLRAATVLLPPESAAWSDDRRRVVLLHELAHVARRDCLAQAVAQLARAVHWFNPLAYLATSRLRAEQERACDDLVLAAGTDAPAYADHLFEIARGFRAEGCPAWATLAMARPSQLEGRVVAILDDCRNRVPPARWARAAVGAVAAALLLPIGALQVTAASRPVSIGPAAPLLSAGERVAASMALEVSDAPPADPAAVDAQWQLPDVDVSTFGRFVDVWPELDVDVDFDFDFDVDAQHDAGPNPDPHPFPDPDPAPHVFVDPFTGGHSATRFRLDGADRAQAASPGSGARAPGQAASQDSGVTDETRRRVADALLTALNDENEEVRQRALEGLASMRDPAAIPALLKALRDPSVEVRERALNALAPFDTPEAVEGVLSALTDQSAGVRARAARQLAVLGSRGRLDDAKYVGVLSGLLKDMAPDVRVQAIVALGRLRRREAVPSLLPLLKDANTDVREQTAVALGLIADPAAIDALTAALKDAEPGVREQAARALGLIARGQRRGTVPVRPVPPVPPAVAVPAIPPLPPGPPQVKLDIGPLQKVVEEAWLKLQETDAWKFQLRQFEFLQQHEDFKRAADEIRRAQDEIRRAEDEIRRETERLFR